MSDRPRENRWLAPRHLLVAGIGVVLLAALWLGLEWIERPGLTAGQLALELLDLLLLAAIGASVAWLVIVRREE